MIHPQMYFEGHFSPAVIRARPWRSCLPSRSAREQREGPAKCRVSRVPESIAGEPQPCHQPAVRGPPSPLLRTTRAGGSLVLPAQVSSDVHTLLGSCSFGACFQPPRGHAWRGCRPRDQTPGLATQSEQPGSDPLPTPAQVGTGAACPVRREEEGLGRPAGAGSGVEVLRALCTPGAGQQRGAPAATDGVCPAPSPAPRPRKPPKICPLEAGPGQFSCLPAWALSPS